MARFNVWRIHASSCKWPDEQECNDAIRFSHDDHCGRPFPFSTIIASLWMEWNRLSTDTRRVYTGGMRIQISLDKPEAIVDAMARKFYVEKAPESTQRAKKMTLLSTTMECRVCCAEVTRVGRNPQLLAGGNDNTHSRQNLHCIWVHSLLTQL
jgi:hypothetical protein